MFQIMEISQTTSVLLVFIITFIMVWWWRNRNTNMCKRGQRLVPRLTWFPFVELLGVFVDNETSLDGMSQSAIVRIKSGFSNPDVVFLNTHELIAEALSKQGGTFSGRPGTHLWEKWSTHNGVVHGILNSVGDLWKEQRKFALVTLRQFGMGRSSSSLCENIQEEIGYLLAKMQTFDGKAVDLEYHLMSSVSNVTNRIVFGNRFQNDDPKFQESLRTINEQFRHWIHAQLPLTYPFLKYLPWDPFKFHYSNTLSTRTREYVQALIKKRVDEYSPDSIECYIDAFIKASKNEKDKPGSTFSDDQLLETVEDFYLAGSGTTTTTLRWGLLLLILHPHVQNKIHEELDNVIGSRRVSMEDRASLPYTEATLLEIQRLGCVVPVVGHSSPVDTTVQDFTIPAGTNVIANFYAVFYDERLWDNARKFNPSRFLDEDGNLKQVPSYFTPFSIGRRNCLGESLAKMELFLHFTSLLQHFSYKIPPGEERPSIKANWGIIRSPYPYKVEMHRR